MFAVTTPPSQLPPRFALPSFSSDPYPESILLDTAIYVASMMTRHIAAMSSSRWIPSHKVCVPGSPSPLRPRKPPRPATPRIASRRVGGILGAIRFLVVNTISAFHSSSSKYTVQGASGTSRPSLVRCGIEKIKTIGDAYMAVGGLRGTISRVVAKQSEALH